MNRLKSVTGVLAALVVIALVAAIVMVISDRGGRKYVVADFPRAIAVYKGSDVRILGINVGQVDSVTPMGTKVRVRFDYDEKYKIPADAKAVVISPSIVGDRFVQLTPVYKSGAVLADNAHLGVDRTATPLELDQIFGSLNQLNLALGPEGANKPDQSGTGALTRLLDSTARNFGGQGVKFNQTLKNLGRLSQTLSNNKDALFGSASEVEKFINTLARNDKTVRQFAESLASGSELLAGDRKDLGRAVDNLAVALKAVRGFVHQNRDVLHTNIKGLTRISNTIVKRRAQLDEVLHVAPLALNNLGLTYDPVSGTLDTRDELGKVVNDLQDNAGGTLCQVLDLDGLSNGAIDCSTFGKPRTAPFAAAAAADAKRFDPTLAGLVGVAR